MKDTIHNKLIILGSGPAGYTAAIYAARANLDPILITGLMEGGQLMQTTTVDNWPGDYSGVLGAELMDRMKKHAKRFKTKIITDHIHTANLTNVKPFVLHGDQATYSSDALIIATGASAKYLGLESEQDYIGKGVSACATCDGFFYKDRVVAVIGGGNTAVEEALYLSNIAKEVIIIHRRNKFRSEKILSEKLLSKNNITVVWNNNLKEVLGNSNSGVTGIKIKNKETDVEKIIELSGVFIAIGHKPNTGIFEGQLEMSDGYIKVFGWQNTDKTTTNIPGVFAAGDVTDRTYKQAITSAGSGCMAALDAERWLDD